MLIRISIFLAIYLVFGCASAPRYSSSKSEKEKEFEQGLTYSRKIFNQPIDILLDGFSTSSRVTKSDGQHKPLSNSNLEKGFGIQIASFRSKENATNFMSELKNQHSNLRLGTRLHDGLWRIFVGIFNTRTEAEKWRDVVHSYGHTSAWIIKFR